MSIAALILTFLCGGLWGWLYAHQVVSTECRRLGKFYVGKRTFTVTYIEDRA